MRQNNIKIISNIVLLIIFTLFKVVDIHQIEHYYNDDFDNDIEQCTICNINHHTNDYYLFDEPEINDTITQIVSHYKVIHIQNRFSTLLNFVYRNRPPPIC